MICGQIFKDGVANKMIATIPQLGNLMDGEDPMDLSMDSPSIILKSVKIGKTRKFIKRLKLSMN